MSTGALPELYAAKVRAELADAGVPEASGELFPSVLVVAAAPADAETVDAAGKALRALGFEAFRIESSRAVEGAGRPPGRLRELIEALDAPVVLAIDGEAAADVAAVLGVDPPRPGVPVRARGRVFGYVGDLGPSLSDETAKRRAWAAFKGVLARPAT